MTRIDFYIVPDSGPNAQAQAACRLVEKAYRLGHQVYVHTPSAEAARHLDELLWTFRQGSFVPHTLHPAEDDAQAPVRVGHDVPPEGQRDVLVNLTTEVPGFFSQFERVAEVVCGDDTARRQGRERYRFYRDRGYSLKSHEL